MTGVLPNDPNTRQCTNCREFFHPYSMVTSKHKPAVAPPVDYKCITCRSRGTQ